MYTEVDFLDISHPDVMQLCLDELRDRNCLGYETYAPYYICSYAMHAFNVMNQGRQVYWESKTVPNLRLHVIFVAPPGYMKTYYLRQMGMDEYSLFGSTNFAMNQKGNLNEAALVGTYKQQGGNYVEREGEAKLHAREFLLIDEYAALSDAMKSNFNAQLDTQMLNALDHGSLVKDMAGGPTISYKTYFTLWGGVQPVKYDLSGGMGRRLCFILNIPDQQLKKDLRRAVFYSKNKRPNVENVVKLQDTINQWSTSFNQVDRIEYDDSVFEMYEELDLEPYELSGFDRLILGWHLAKGHIEPVMSLNVEDKQLHDLLMRQYSWRSDIQKGPDLIQVANMIKEHGEKLDGDEHKYYIKMSSLNSICTQMQMSIQQIHEKIDEMKKYDMVTSMGKGIICYEED